MLLVPATIGSNQAPALPDQLSTSRGPGRGCYVDKESCQVRDTGQLFDVLRIGGAPGEETRGEWLKAPPSSSTVD